MSKLQDSSPGSHTEEAFSSCTDELMSCDVCGMVSSRVLIRDAVSDFSSEAGHFGIFCPNVPKFSKKQN